MEPAPLLIDRFNRLMDRIAHHETQYDRPAGSVSLLAVTKTQSIDTLKAALEIGIHCFGENYLQEALLKISALKAFSPEWHFIGRVQSNKTRLIAEQFAWVHSVTSMKMAKRLNDQRPKNLPPLNICIQINLHSENGRIGINESELMQIAEFCSNLKRIRLRGLMALPVPTENIEARRASFRHLFTLFNSLRNKDFHVDTLSAGTTGDMAEAIAEGSTLIRIGTALFGSRKSHSLPS